MFQILIAAISLSAAAAQTVSTVPGASQQVLSQPLQFVGYGTHQPHGLAAVRYMYSPEGTWRSYTGLKNIYGYYNVPQDTKNQLIAYANGNNPATCPDPNSNVLWDLPYNSATASGSSFMGMCYRP